jgi:hypothetical protein
MNEDKDFKRNPESDDPMEWPVEKRVEIVEKLPGLLNATPEQIGESREFVLRMMEAGPGPGDMVKLKDGTVEEWSEENAKKVMQFVPGMGPQVWFPTEKEFKKLRKKQPNAKVPGKSKKRKSMRAEAAGADGVFEMGSPGETLWNAFQEEQLPAKASIDEVADFLVGTGTHEEIDLDIEHGHRLGLWYNDGETISYGDRSSREGAKTAARRKMAATERLEFGSREEAEAFRDQYDIMGYAPTTDDDAVWYLQSTGGDDLTRTEFREKYQSRGTPGSSRMNDTNMARRKRAANLAWYVWDSLMVMDGPFESQGEAERALKEKWTTKDVDWLDVAQGENYGGGSGSIQRVHEKHAQMPIGAYQVEQRRKDTPVEVHWVGSDLARAKEKAREYSMTDDGIAYVVGGNKVITKFYQGEEKDATFSSKHADFQHPFDLYPEEQGGEEPELDPGDPASYGFTGELADHRKVVMDFMHYNGSRHNELTDREWRRLYLMADGFGPGITEEFAQNQLEWDGSHVRDSSVEAIEDIYKALKARGYLREGARKIAGRKVAGVKVYDNGGTTMDRYTVVIDGSVYTMSENAHAPNGVNMYAGEESEGYGPQEGDAEVPVDQLPEDLQRAITDRQSDSDSFGQGQQEPEEGGGQGPGQKHDPESGRFTSGRLKTAALDVGEGDIVLVRNDMAEETKAEVRGIEGSQAHVEWIEGDLEGGLDMIPLSWIVQVIEKNPIPDKEAEMSPWGYDAEGNPQSQEDYERKMQESEDNPGRAIARWEAHRGKRYIELVSGVYDGQPSYSYKGEGTGGNLGSRFGSDDQAIDWMENDPSSPVNVLRSDFSSTRRVAQGQDPEQEEPLFDDDELTTVQEATPPAPGYKIPPMPENEHAQDRQAGIREVADKIGQFLAEFFEKVAEGWVPKVLFATLAVKYVLDQTEKAKAANEIARRGLPGILEDSEDSEESLKLGEFDVPFSPNDPANPTGVSGMRMWTAQVTDGEGPPARIFAHDIYEAAQLLARELGGTANVDGSESSAGVSGTLDGQEVFYSLRGGRRGQERSDVTQPAVIIGRKTAQEGEQTELFDEMIPGMEYGRTSDMSPEQLAKVIRDIIKNPYGMREPSQFLNIEPSTTEITIDDLQRHLSPNYAIPDIEPALNYGAMNGMFEVTDDGRIVIAGMKMAAEEDKDFQAEFYGQPQDVAWSPEGWVNRPVGESGGWTFLAHETWSIDRVKDMIIKAWGGEIKEGAKTGEFDSPFSPSDPANPTGRSGIRSWVGQEKGGAPSARIYANSIYEAASLLAGELEGGSHYVDGSEMFADVTGKLDGQPVEYHVTGGRGGMEDRPDVKQPAVIIGAFHVKQSDKPDELQHFRAAFYNDQMDVWWTPDGWMYKPDGDHSGGRFLAKADQSIDEVKAEITSVLDGEIREGARRIAARKNYEADDEHFNADAYAVESYPGIAWQVLGWETEPDEDTEWSGFENRTGQVVAVMVGDDRHFVFDESEIKPISGEDYCPECGQMGHSHYGCRKRAAWDGSSLKSGKTFSVTQRENGVYMADIRDEFGDVESATNVSTMQEVWRWLKEHGEEPTEGEILGNEAKTFEPQDGEVEGIFY